MIGHLKSCIIILLGFLLFQKQTDVRQLTGIGMTLAGIIIYTWLNQPKDKPSSSKT